MSWGRKKKYRRQPWVWRNGCICKRRKKPKYPKQRPSRSLQRVERVWRDGKLTWVAVEDWKGGVWSKRRYRLFLESAYWKALKARFKKSAGFTGKCAECGEMDDLDIHHKTYERIGREKLTDLEALCRECHEKRHAA